MAAASPSSVVSSPPPFGRGGAGDFGEGLGESGGAGQTGLGVVPIAQIDDLLVGAQLQCAGVTLDQIDEAGGVGETVLAQ